MWLNHFDAITTLWEFTTWEFMLADANFLFHLAMLNKSWPLSILY